MKKLILSTLLLLCTCLGISAASWNNMKSDYSDEFVVYVGLKGADGSSIYNGTLGAFIGDECRGEARVGVMKVSDDNVPGGAIFYFPVRIGGSASDNGNAITFKYEDEAGNVYTLNNSSNPLNYRNEDYEGTVSALYTMTLNAAQSIYMDQTITLNVGQTIDVRDYVKPYPEGSQLPDQLDFISSDDAYFTSTTRDGSIFEALKPYTNMKEDLMVTAYMKSDSQIEKNCSTTVTILQPITSIKIADEYKNVTVELGDNTGLRKIVSGCYTVNPADATERVAFKSSDETVIKMVLNKTTRVMVPQTQGPGTCVLTISSPDGKISDKMTVTVIKPVEELVCQTCTLKVEKGDALKELMAANVSVLPVDATDLTYTVTSSNTAVVDNNLNAVGVGTATLTVKTGYVGAQGPLAQTIDVYVSEKHSISVVNKTLAFTETAYHETVAEKIAANISWTPSDAYVSLVSNNPKVFNCFIDQNNQLWVEIGGKGEAEITAGMQYWKEELVDGVVKGGYKQISETFKVVISEALSGFAIADVRMGNADSKTITITPQPAGAEYDKSKISVVVVPDYQMVQGWELASVAASGNTRLKWTVQAKSVGSGDIYVKYDGQTISSARINIGQTIKPEAGWKWVSVYTTSANVEKVYGDNLIEARGEYEIVHNDPVYGYFGDLYRMTFLGGYKVKNEAAADSYVLFREGGSNDPYYFPHGSFSLPIHPKWNWIGSPYQYDHAIEDVFPKALDGDRIVSKTNGFAEYRNGEWVGTLTTIKAGLAYIYYSNQTENAAQKEFQFRAENEFPQGTPVANAKGVKAANSVWSYDDSAFADNMSMIAKADVDNADNYTVGAFVGDECRGEGEAVKGNFFITVHGKAGELVTFKLYNKTTGSYVGVANAVRLTQAAGTCSAPVRLDLEDAATSVDAAEAVAGTAVVTVRTLGGAVVDCSDIDALPAGAYIVTSKDANGKTATRKIVK